MIVKHKRQLIVKHKELMPWELHPPGSARKTRMVEGFNEKDGGRIQ